MKTKILKMKTKKKRQDRKERRTAYIPILNQTQKNELVQLIPSHPISSSLSHPILPSPSPFSKIKGEAKGYIQIHKHSQKKSCLITSLLTSSPLQNSINQSKFSLSSPPLFFSFLLPSSFLPQSFSGTSNSVKNPPGFVLRASKIFFFFQLLYVCIVCLTQDAK